MCVPLLLLTLVVSLAAGIPQGRGQAPVQESGPGFSCEEDGFYEDFDQCDKYWECKGARSIPHLCDDGLVFDHLKARAGHVDPCDTPLVVDCTGRSIIQEPTYPHEYCTRRHGIFADPDPSICNRFHTCKDGFKESTTDCTPGLHFDPLKAICTWPDAAGRVGCFVKDTACINNGTFCCTGEQVLTDAGVAQPHPSYLNPEDCQKFYVCLNGLTPQESSCPLGQVFNDITSLCDYPENVPDCGDYYLNHPLFEALYDDAV